MVRTFFTHLRRQWMGALALFLVLTGGTAYALDGSNTVFTDDIVNGEVKTGDIRDANITKDDLGPNSVNSAKVVDDSLTGGDVSESTLDIGAYAYVDVTGGCPGDACTPTQSHGISSVTHDGLGIYCVTAPGIDSNVTPAAVTVDSANTSDPEGNASAMTEENGCGGDGEGFRVTTEFQPEVLVPAPPPGGGTPVPTPVSGPAQPADGISFTIVIP